MAESCTARELQNLRPHRDRRHTPLCEHRLHSGGSEGAGICWQQNVGWPRHRRDGRLIKRLELTASDLME